MMDSTSENVSTEPVEQSNTSTSLDSADNSNIAETDKRIAQLEARINGQSAALGKMTSLLESMQKVKEEAPAVKDDSKPVDAPKGDALQYQEMQKQLKELTDKSERQKAAGLRNAMKNALLEREADPYLADVTVKALLADNANAFHIEEDEVGNFNVRHRSYDGVEVDLKTWAESYIASDSGQRILSAKRPPFGHSPNSTESGVDGIQIINDPKELNKLSPDALKSGKVKFAF